MGARERVSVCVYLHCRAAGRIGKWRRSADSVSLGVATISRLLKIMGLFCKRALSKRPYSAKETYNFKEPTSRSYTPYVRASERVREKERERERECVCVCVFSFPLSRALFQ